MHTFGHPVDIEQISKVCLSWNIPIIEDAAESFGSRFKSKLTGTFGRCGAISFNGNKIITAGGGGAMILNNYKDYKLAKHLASQAKIAHKYEYFHDMLGHNYKMPSLNASLLFSQIKNKVRSATLRFGLFLFVIIFYSLETITSEPPIIWKY